MLTYENIFILYMQKINIYKALRNYNEFFFFFFLNLNIRSNKTKLSSVAPQHRIKTDYISIYISFGRAVLNLRFKPFADTHNFKCHNINANKMTRRPIKFNCFGNIATVWLHTDTLQISTSIKSDVSVLT